MIDYKYTTEQEFYAWLSHSFLKLGLGERVLIRPGEKCAVGGSTAISVEVLDEGTDKCHISSCAFYIFE